MVVCKEKNKYSFGDGEIRKQLCLFLNFKVSLTKLRVSLLGNILVYLQNITCLSSVGVTNMSRNTYNK